MDEENEFRRRQLKRLVDSLGRGGISLLAGKLDVSPTYISRMLSDPRTKQHRAVTGDTVIAISKLYPDWLSPSDNLEPRERENLAADPGSKYSTELDSLVTRLKTAQKSAADFPAICKAVHSILDLAMKQDRYTSTSKRPEQRSELKLAQGQISFNETVAKLTGGRSPNKNSK